MQIFCVVEPNWYQEEFLCQEKGKMYGFENVPTDGAKLMMQKIISMNSLSIQMDEGIGLVQR